MLFRKKIEPRCAYCAHAARVDAHTVVCDKRGIVLAGEHCRKFEYDPLKRVPPKKPQLVTNGLSDEDFRIE